MKKNLFLLTASILISLYSHSQGCKISLYPTTLCIDGLIKFEIPVAAYASILWEFGDSSTSAIPMKVYHTYTTRGNYKVKVTTYNSFGQITCQDSIEITVYDKPNACITLPSETTQCFKGNYFCFTDCSTPGKDNAPITSWYWDFGDGDSSHQHQQSPCKIYLQSSRYEIIFQVIDANGCTDTVIKTASIRVLPKLAPIFKTVYTITCPSTPVRFINQTDSVGKDIVGWYWDFDNGNYDSSMTNWTDIIEMYYKDGAFDPKFTIVSKFGCVDSFVGFAAARNIYYEFDIKSSVNGLPTCWSGNQICYSQKRRPFAYYWLWNFDDPQTSPNDVNDVEWTACHTYSSSGFYAVTLDIWEPNCHRDTTYCNYAKLKGPKAMIKLPPPPAFPPNDCREGEIIPLEVFNRYASWCLNPGRDSIFYATRQYIGPYLASVERFYCNADTTNVDTIFESCGDTLKTIIQINYQISAYDHSKTIYHYDSIQEMNGGKFWIPPNTSSASNPVTPPPGVLYYSQSGICTPQTMHDTDEYIPNCQGPNYVRFTNNSIKYRLYYAIDDNPTTYTFLRDDVSQDICKNPSYPWASDSMQHFWDFDDLYSNNCTSTVSIPDMTCGYSTEIAPWHLYSQSGCYNVELRVIDTITQCTSNTTVKIIMEEPDAGFDPALVDSFNNDTTHLPIDRLDWQSQSMIRGLSKQLNRNRGLILEGVPCVDFNQTWDLSETIPSCGRQTYWMLFDSARDCDPFCTDTTYMDLDGNGSPELHIHKTKKCNWLPEPILEQMGMSWSYSACHQLIDPNCPCKTIGLIIQSGDCFDTFFYHDYKYIYNLDASFDVLTWRDYSPSPDSLKPINLSEANILVDKNGDGIPDYVIPKLEQYKLCPEHELILTPQIQWQNSVVEYTFEVQRSFAPPWVEANSILENSITRVRDTIYRLCHKDSFTINIFTGDTIRTYCWLFPDPTTGCGVELYPNTTSLQDFLNKGFQVENVYEILDLRDTVYFKDQNGRSLWEPGKYSIISFIKNTPTDPLDPLAQCSNFSRLEIHVGHWTNFGADDRIVCYENGGDTVTFSGQVRYFSEKLLPYWSDTLSTPYWIDPFGIRGGTPQLPSIEEYWDWDLDGDSIFETKSITGSEQVTFVYDKPGNYTVRMRTWDSNGCVQVLERKDFIKVIGTVANFELKQQLDICAPQLADFRNLSYGLNEWQYTYDKYGQVIDSVLKDSIIHYYWNFGDPKSGQYANYSTLKNPQHTFENIGSYDITLAVSNSNGCVDTILKPSFIEIIGPVPQFRIIGATVKSIDSATFYIKDSSENVTTWIFKKGDSNKVTFNQRPVDSIFAITYTETGTFYLCLTGMDTFWSNATMKWISCSLTYGDCDGNDPKQKDFIITVLHSTSVPEYKGKSFVNIYPNPTNDEIIIDIELNKKQNVNISVYNVLGHTIKHLKNFTVAKKCKIDLSQYNSGIYIVRIRTENEVITRSIYLVK